ncbi:MAG: DUF4215 domain-containing protein [Candidatus Binatia bacterium]|nr:DUF4215 domain-containing protein [Candidatus Binatia bacterium]
MDCWASGFCYQSNQSENTTRPDAAFGPATQARCDAAGLQRAWGEGVDYASNRYWSAWQTQEWVNPWSICNENVCGDGVAVLGREACDDGDTDNGDGCSSTCTVESGWDCSSGTCVDINECATNADNCDTNATCSNTTGNFDCDCNAGYTGDGQTCETECGDGIPVGAEECDDGNTNDGDCCSSTCNFEAAGDSCDDQDGNGCTEGQCGGLGDCVAHPVSDGDPCTQDGAFCNGAESCQAGACAGAGDPCMGGGECADQCDEVNDTCNRPAGDPCTEDGEACTLDQCDGAGACAHPAGNGGELCRSEGGPICDPAEYCDGVNPTCPTDFVEPNTTECKAGAEDTCDPAEYCTGVAGEACPADEWADDGTSCDDGDATTSNDECVLGMCVCPGSPDDDVDDDGMPDLCDPDDGSIVVNQATAWPRRSKKARFIAKMSMTTDADTALDLSGGISVAFSDAASMLEQVDFAAEDCITKARGRKVQCRLADKTAKLLISQDKKDTSKYSMKLVVTKRGFESPVVGPIGVRVTAGDLDRTGQNANCTQRNAKTACR